MVMRWWRQTLFVSRECTVNQQKIIMADNNKRWNALIVEKSISGPYRYWVFHSMSTILSQNTFEINRYRPNVFRDAACFRLAGFIFVISLRSFLLASDFHYVILLCIRSYMKFGFDIDIELCEPTCNTQQTTNMHQQASTDHFETFRCDAWLCHRQMSVLVSRGTQHLF